MAARRVQDQIRRTEKYDVFFVRQLTRGTPLEAVVGADWVYTPPGSSSEIHRHNKAETVLFVIKGAGVIRIGQRNIRVKSGDRIRIGKGVYHGVRTKNKGLFFISIQSPPILDKKKGALDLEPLNKSKA